MEGVEASMEVVEPFITSMQVLMEVWKLFMEDPTNFHKKKQTLCTRPRPLFVGLGVFCCYQT